MLTKNIKIKKIKNCFIAYIDILGFSEATKEKEQIDVLCEAINYIENAKKDLAKEVDVNAKRVDTGFQKVKGFRIKTRIFSISDSIFITTNLTNRRRDKKFEVADNFTAFEHLQRISARIAYICMQRKFLVRGCIGYSAELAIVGNSLISDSIPTLVRMEKEFSYPRILMNDSIIDYFSNNKADLYKSYCIGHLPLRQNFILDSDGLYFLNWIGYLKIFQNLRFNVEGHNIEKPIDLSLLEKIIEEKLASYYDKNPKKFSKWFWMKTYFNKVLKLN